jgi:hypothetical protein
MTPRRTIGMIFAALAAGAMGIAAGNAAAQSLSRGPSAGPARANMPPTVRPPARHPSPGIVLSHPFGGDDLLSPVGPLPPRIVNTPPLTRGNPSPSPGARNNPPGLPPSGEQRFVPDEVIIEVSNGFTPQQAEALARRHRLTRVESQSVALTNSTIFRWRIPDRRSVTTVIRQLAAAGIRSQPNYTHSLQQEAAYAPPAGGERKSGDPAQYALQKLHVPRAHELANGDRVLVAVIDSGIDASHPELAGAVAEQFDAIAPGEPDAHGTAIAGAICAHARLLGVAPRAQILAARAFDPGKRGAEGTSFGILKSLDWAIAQRARIINMSFVGPADPLLARALSAARQRGAVLIAATGNAGAKSPPLFPAADPNVIAVTATDAQDHLFADAVRGNHVALAAPGVDILLPVPGGSYRVNSGTSFAAAHVSGIAALVLERNPQLLPEAVRRILMAAARDLGPKGRDPQFGAGLADAYRATLGAAGPSADAAPAQAATR